MFSLNFRTNIYDPDTGDGFSMDKALSVFESRKSGKKQKYLTKMLKSKDFYGYIFVDTTGESREKTKELYNLLAKPENVEVIWYTVCRDNDLEDFPRSAAVFLFTVCQYILEYSNNTCRTIELDAVRNKVSGTDRLMELRSSVTNLAKDINHALNDAVSPYAKKLARESGIPKDICIAVYKSVPQKSFITKDMIGTYLNIITDILYQEIDEYISRKIGDTADIDPYSRDFDEIDRFVDRIDWKPFFKMVLGDDFAKEIAMYLTVEGASRINRTWKNKNIVQAVWDSLTEYALTTLDKLSEGEREHMLDLYRKIVASMSGDRKEDLRVDLTKREIVSSDRFPNLAKSINKAYDKIKEAVDIARGAKERKHAADEDIPQLN